MSKPFSTTSALSCGKAPGCQVHTGQILVLGWLCSRVWSFLQRQKILLSLESLRWISSPMVIRGSCIMYKKKMKANRSIAIYEEKTKDFSFFYENCIL